MDASQAGGSHCMGKSSVSVQPYVIDFRLPADSNQAPVKDWRILVKTSRKFTEEMSVFWRFRIISLWIN